MHLGREYVSDYDAKLKVLLQRVNKGEKLYGEILIKENQLFLKVENNYLIPVQLHEELKEEQPNWYEVVDKQQEEWVVKAVKVPQTEVLLEEKSNKLKEENTSCIDKVLEELQLNHIPKCKSIIESLMSRQLPLVKNEIIKIMHMKEQYHLPIEPMLNIIEHHQAVDIKQVALVVESKRQFEQSGLTSKLIDVLEVLSLPEHQNLYKALTQTLSTKEFERDVVPFIKDIISQSTDIQNKNDSIEVLQQSVPSSFSLRQLCKLNKVLMQSRLGINIHNLEETPLKEMKKMEGSILELEHMIKRTLEETKETNEVQSSREEIIEAFKAETKALEVYQTLGHYFTFPLYKKEQYIPAELYFFKPNKKSNKKKPEYIVLALDLPNIRRIEVHFIVQNEITNIELKVQSEAVKTLILKYEKVLHESIKEGQSVGKIKVSLLTPDEQSIYKQADYSMSSMDIKV